ncbi:MAG: DNA polymerase III subunit beta, partial [Hyphomicrobiales bacterium]
MRFEPSFANVATPARRGFWRLAGNKRKKMKVTLERNHLLKSLGHVHRVVERRNTYP